MSHQPFAMKCSADIPLRCRCETVSHLLTFQWTPKECGCIIMLYWFGGDIFVSSRRYVMMITSETTQQILKWLPLSSVKVFKFSWRLLVKILEIFCLSSSSINRDFSLLCYVETTFLYRYTWLSEDSSWLLTTDMLTQLITTITISYTRPPVACTSMFEPQSPVLLNSVRTLYHAQARYTALALGRIGEVCFSTL